MVLPLVVPAIVAASTAAGLATPFFFPTPQDKATIELNNRLKQGNFTIVKTEKEIKEPNFEAPDVEEITDNIKAGLEVPKNQFILIGIAILVIILAVSR